uniref:Uncharacterized protein n=1 Tax=Lepeophtheirus salmonis TaxID=72036 RepID=A0A0K2T016_LEPSM
MNQLARKTDGTILPITSILITYINCIEII